MDMTLNFHADPGHGWLEAPRVLIDELGIAHKVTACSYQQGDAVYLEEDCDAPLLVKALEARGDTIAYNESYAEVTPIRRMEAYHV